MLINGNHLIMLKQSSIINAILCYTTKFKTLIKINDKNPLNIIRHTIFFPLL